MSSIDPYDPASYWQAAKDGTYKDYYIVGTFWDWMASVNWAVPNFSAYSSLNGNFEYWSAIMEWKPLRALGLFAFTNMFFMTLITYFFQTRRNILRGDEAPAYTDDYKYDDYIDALSW